MDDRILGLDLGTKRLGVAVSDAMGWTAQPVGTFRVSGPDDILDRARALLKEYEAERLVVGLPTNMDGSPGPKADEAREMADRLRKELDVEVVLWDERLSSVEAERRMAEEGLGWRERKGKVDTVAAQIILQGYLDRQAYLRKQEGGFPPEP